MRVGEAEILTGPDAKAENSFEDPGVIRSVPLDGVAIERGTARLTMPPLSFAAATFELG
jgi:alpha-L-arabinofuranosidase